MNYLELINRFWSKDIEYHFSDKETALYFYLLSISNSIHWKNPFGLSNAMTIAKFGWGKTSFDTAKNRLKSAGLIDFKPGDGRGNVYQYLIKGIEKGNEVTLLSDTLSSLSSEKVTEKDTQMLPLSDTLPIAGNEKEVEKGTQTTPLSDTLFESIEKGTQKHTLSGTLSNTLSDNLSNPKPATSINNKHKPKSKEKGTIPFFNNNEIDIDLESKYIDEDKREKEKKVEKKEKEVLALFHAICKSYPKVSKLTDHRKEKMLRRLTEIGDIKVLEKVFENMEASEFLKGNNKTGWKATFDWVFENQNNWVKILEGNYDSKPVNDARFIGILQTDINKF